MSNDDLGPDELDHASAPSYSSRQVVDEWCRRLAAEVRRHRRATPPPAAPLLAPAEREVLGELRGWLANVDYQGRITKGVQWAVTLSRLLAASPSQPVAPATPPAGEPITREQFRLAMHKAFRSQAIEMFDYRPEVAETMFPSAADYGLGLRLLKELFGITVPDYKAEPAKEGA